MEYEIVRYAEQWESKWDRFVMNDSVNGTFLQTRRFLNYHPPKRFEDASMLVVQGSQIVAVIPACKTVEDGKKCFYSHKGSTFGGLILAGNKYSTRELELVFPLFERFLKAEGYQCTLLKPTSDLFSRESGDLLDYYFYKNNYQVFNELSFFAECENRGEDITSFWTSSKRRDYRYSTRNHLRFQEIRGMNQLKCFHSILSDALVRHGTAPVHSSEELMMLRETCIPEIVRFYGVFLDESMIAGTMLFSFGNSVLHTQYLAQDGQYADLYPMSFLIYHVFQLAREKGFKRLSFGISTENRGMLLNTGLASFKEGFGARYCCNRTYFKEL